MHRLDLMMPVTVFDTTPNPDLDTTLNEVASGPQRRDSWYLTARRQVQRCGFWYNGAASGPQWRDLRFNPVAAVPDPLVSLVLNGVASGP